MTLEGAARRLLACLDLTELSDTCLPTQVDAVCGRASTPFGTVAAICIHPSYVAQAATALKGRAIGIATVINFPAGGLDIERALDDTKEAVRDGATEIDLVTPYAALVSGDPAPMREMIAAIAEALPAHVKLKAILETGMLKTPTLIRQASEIAIASGAHFLKTSTGKTDVSATPEAARIMLETIRDSSAPVGFKASGGLRTLRDTLVYLELADGIMGPDWAKPATFRIGASALLGSLLDAIQAPSGAG